MFQRNVQLEVTNLQIKHFVYVVRGTALALWVRVPADLVKLEKWQMKTGQSVVRTHVLHPGILLN